ncbi:MAG TPA: branched-chain amino acid ABC transporter permease, partial [Acidimicrobiia bacterium]|nr:branched-chain amino acid ABC transporter permease [Acidimicrobiia bacterium]
MKDFLPFIVVGVTTGSVYALAGVGLVLTFKTSGIFNFAHGTQAALAAYIMFEFRERNGWPWPLAAAATLVLVGVVGGLLLERLAQVLAGATAAARVAATVGLLVGIQGAIVALFGPAVLPMRSFLPTTTFSVGDVNIRYEQLIVMLLALGAVVALYLLFARTRLGAGMQAVVDDPSLFALQGTNPARVRRAAWIIGSSFAAVSGMLL